MPPSTGHMVDTIFVRLKITQLGNNAIYITGCTFSPHGIPGGMSRRFQQPGNSEAFSIGRRCWFPAVDAADPTRADRGNGCNCGFFPVSDAHNEDSAGHRGKRWLPGCSLHRTNRCHGNRSTGHSCQPPPRHTTRRGTLPSTILLLN